jgi:hypothetical protein
MRYSTFTEGRIGSSFQFHIALISFNVEEIRLSLREPLYDPLGSRAVQRRVVGEIIMEWKGMLAACFHGGIVLCLFDSVDGGNMFLRNVGWLSTDYTALYFSLCKEVVSA